MIDIDNNVYQTIEIDNFIWTTQDLMVKRFSNGDVIRRTNSSNEWLQALKNYEPAYLESNHTSGKINSCFYNYYAISDPRGLAPINWEIPHATHWDNLIQYLGGQLVAGKKMKTTHSWRDKENFLIWRKA